MPKHTIAEVIAFLNNQVQLPSHCVSDEEDEILRDIDSYGAYKIAMRYAHSLEPSRAAFMLRLIGATWDQYCLQEASRNYTFSAQELKRMLKEAPDGLLAQQCILRLLFEVKELL